MTRQRVVGPPKKRKKKKSKFVFHPLVYLSRVYYCMYCTTLFVAGRLSSSLTAARLQPLHTVYFPYTRTARIGDDTSGGPRNVSVRSARSKMNVPDLFSCASVLPIPLLPLTYSSHFFLPVEHITYTIRSRMYLLYVVYLLRVLHLRQRVRVPAIYQKEYLQACICFFLILLLSSFLFFSSLLRAGEGKVGRFSPSQPSFVVAVHQIFLDNVARTLYYT